jgi:hypothetical protein
MKFTMCLCHYVPLPLCAYPENIWVSLAIGNPLKSDVCCPIYDIRVTSHERRATNLGGLYLPAGKHTGILTHFRTKVNKKRPKRHLFWVILPAPHELGSCRCVPPQVANLRNLERGKLVRGLLVNVRPLNCCFL